MSTLLRPFARLSIASRLILLFAGVVLGLAGGTAYIAGETARQVAALEAVNERLELRRQLIDLETEIAAYVTLLEARQSVVLNQDFANLMVLRRQIAGSREQIETALSALSAGGDPAGLRGEIDTLREIHDSYLTHTVEGSFVPALEARNALLAQKAALDLLFDTLAPETSASLSGVVTDLDTMSREIGLTASVVIPGAILAAAGALLLLLVSVWRPLRRLIGTIERLDEPDQSIEIDRNGPAEFQAIARALSALQERLMAQRRAEAQARESAEKLQQFTDATLDVLWETGPDLRFTWVHTRSSTLQAVRERAIGLTRWEAARADPETDPKWRRHREELLARRPFRNFEYGGGYESGVRRWWRASGEPFYDADGTFLGYRGATVSITEQKRYEEQLRRAQNMEMMARFTSGVAHDFNNLLTVLSSNLELLSRRQDFDAEVREMLSRCERATLRGRKLSSQLLSLGHRPEVRPVLVYMGPLLADFDDLIRRSLPQTIAVETRFAPDLPEALVDPGLLQDALLNLVINARDAMPDGGRLGVCATSTRRALLLTVSDTGSGVDPALLERIFEPFFTTKREGKGTGLGLSMVSDFAMRSGGTVDIQSAPDVGTTVTLTLPLPQDGLPGSLPDRAIGVAGEEV
ncbi:MAG: ATP-binding protein [Pseudomonadota bacterium]